MLPPLSRELFYRVEASFSKVSSREGTRAQTARRASVGGFVGSSVDSSYRQEFCCFHQRQHSSVWAMWMLAN